MTGEIPTLHCRGKCKREKFVYLFSPSQVKSKRPICMKCIRESVKRSNVQRTSAWKGWAAIVINEGKGSAA